jgi:hypothetical protein
VPTLDFFLQATTASGLKAPLVQTTSTCCIHQSDRGSHYAAQILLAKTF